ncbi:MAG: dihydroorotase [Sulfuricurvum sp. PC08-66]|nr:MAG: dihydroorotase [Sulfuricurvum sp. PC08-66]
MNGVILSMPLDMHLHLRDHEMLEVVAPLTAHTFSGALVMPNLVPPVKTRDAVIAYRKRILDAVEGHNDFEPYMTLFFDASYDKAFLQELRDDILALKLYPAGITTNSQGGVAHFDIETLRPTLEAMSELGIPLCVHGETNGFVMERETEFMTIYARLASEFPNLKIIMEHITTQAAVELLELYENLYATITVHHLLITLDDVAGGLMQPHLFCKPIAKRPQDRAALLDVALRAHPKVMFGSDSAPHPQHAKESCGCAAGVFTAPIALQLLCDIFDRHDALENLQAFVSTNAENIYGICPAFKEVTLIRQPFLVPEKYGSVVPMYAGQTLPWSIGSVQ